MLKRNSITVHPLVFIQTRNSSHYKPGACQKSDPASRMGDFENFRKFSLKAHYIISLHTTLGAD